MPPPLASFVGIADDFFWISRASQWLYCVKSHAQWSPEKGTKILRPKIGRASEEDFTPRKGVLVRPRKTAPLVKGSYLCSFFSLVDLCNPLVSRSLRDHFSSYTRLPGPSESPGPMCDQPDLLDTHFPLAVTFCDLLPVFCYLLKSGI